MRSRSIAHCLLFASAFALTVVVTPRASQAQEGLGERIGQQIDRGLERLGDEIRENWKSLRQFVDKLGVQGRVYARLRWDKDLEQSKLVIDVNDAGVVELSGKVSSEIAKQKAIELTTDTIGVTEVVESLTVTTESLF